MEILDPDLWNDDGTPKRPTADYMKRLSEAQHLEAVDPETPFKRAAEVNEAFVNYARIKRDAKAQRSPEVGDIVHFWDDEHARCRAAMVMETDPYSDGATLRVHIPHEFFQDWECSHDEDKSGDTWHWPCGEGQ